MKKLKKIKAIITGIFNNIPAYAEMTLQAMGMSMDSMKSLGLCMNRSEQEKFNEFMTNYVNSLEKSFKAHKKELERVLTREFKKLTFEQLDFIEMAVDPEMLKSMTAVNMAIVPTVMKISVDAMTESGVMDFAKLGGFPAPVKAKKRAIVRKRTKSRKRVAKTSIAQDIHEATLATSRKVGREKWKSAKIKAAKRAASWF